MLQIQEIFKIAKVYMPFSIIRNGVLVTFEEFIFNLKEMLVINETFVASVVFNLFKRKVMGGPGSHFTGAKQEPQLKRNYNSMKGSKIIAVYETMRDGGSSITTGKVMLSNRVITHF